MHLLDTGIKMLRTILLPKGRRQSCFFLYPFEHRFKGYNTLRNTVQSPSETPGTMENEEDLASREAMIRQTSFRERSSGRKWIWALGATVFVALGAVIRHRAARNSSPPTSLDLPRNVVTPPPCKRTKFFPFLVGCPRASICRARRPELRKDEKLYRTNVAWPFGKLDGFHSSGKVNDMSDADLRRSFHCPPKLVRDFLKLENDLVSAVDTGVRERTVASRGTPQSLQKMFQAKIHVSLSYFCCLTAEEISKMKTIIPQWISRHNFSIPVRLNRIECWHERPDSVTNIVIADSESEERLGNYNRDLRDELIKGGVPIVCSREEQMPYHSTLLGFHVRQGELVDPFLDIIAQGISKVNSDIDFSTVIEGNPDIAPAKELRD